ncbi:hypothetical protein DFAR_1180015 [Desulfarculales bacterium]
MAAAVALGSAQAFTEASVDLTCAFPALPGLPLMITFNDADEELFRRG